MNTINTKISKILILSFFILLSLDIEAQKINDFNSERNRSQKKAMTILTTWASLNIGLGTIGSLTHSGESKYFHQMNVGWNLVNLGLGISGLVQAKKETTDGLDLHQSLTKYRKTANAFLFNSALNLTYITAGGLLLERSKNNPENYTQLQGFGKSLILQGGFLLFFDLSAYFVQRRNRIKRLDPFIKNVTLSSKDLGLVFHF